MDGEREAVLGGVAAGEVGVVGLQLEPVQVEAGDAGGEAERRGAGAAAEVEHALARTGPGRRRRAAPGRWRRGSRARGCQSRRRPSRKASQVSSAGAKLIPERRRPRRCRAGPRGRGRRRASATISRRGRMPIEPSSTLMWTSRTKQSISSPRSSAVLKAMTVGSLVRRSSRMARSLETAPAEVESQARWTLPRGPRPLRGPAGGAGRATWQRVNALIRARMASEHAPRIPEVTAHLVEAGGKRLRPLLTLAAARLCGYARRAPPAAGGDGGVHPHRDAAARRRGRRERAAARAADGEPALGQQVERAGRGLPVRARVPADGRDRASSGCSTSSPTPRR